jgi:regulator of replication initiation timing
MQGTISNMKQVKLDNISNFKLKQLQYEIDTWKRLLGFMIEENIHLKIRLSEVLKNKFDHNLLEEVEGFYNKIIKEDDLFLLLRNEINELDKLFDNIIFKEEDVLIKANRKFKRFRNNINATEKQFGKLKMNFNNYLLENTQIN